jgi:hypothetical protein
MRGGPAALLAVALAAGCSRQQSQREARHTWVTEQSRKNPLDALRLELSGTPELDFLDGWYPVEHDVESGIAWRWMGRRAIVRLRLLDGAEAVHEDCEHCDVELSIHGWIPHEHLGLAARRLTSLVNGHVLDEFEPPNERFVRTFVVPAQLLAAGESLELALVVANTVRPQGDERQLGFATSGITWARASTAR